MKVLVFLLFVLTIIGCNQQTDEDILKTAAIHFSDVFIRENIVSVPTFRVKGKADVKSKGDSIFYVTGSAEGFTSFNAPVAIKRFSETLRYLGGNLNERKNWECKEIYIGNKKIK